MEHGRPRAVEHHLSQPPRPVLDVVDARSARHLRVEDLVAEVVLVLEVGVGGVAARLRCGADQDPWAVLRDVRHALVVPARVFEEEDAAHGGGGGGIGGVTTMLVACVCAGWSSYRRKIF